MSQIFTKRIGRVLTGLGAAVLVLATATVACGQSTLPYPEYNPNNDPPREDAHLHAILIGCERYQNFPELRFCGNDCTQLAKTLNERGGYSVYNVTLVVDNAQFPQEGPVRDTVMRSLEQKFSELKADDQVLVFFSGHGYRDPDGSLYLCTLDFDAERPAETGVPVSWLRDQLAACPAKLKLLVLDACHAGSEKGASEKSVPSKDLGEPFRDIAGVVTLASSAAEEKSQLWEEKEQSLFTYWLNQGLKGHADENGDSEVDIDELNKYVHRNVTHVAKEKFNRVQTPVRILRSTPGSPVVLRLSALSLKQMLSDIADQLSWAIEDQKLEKVAVFDFTTETSLGEVLGANFGMLGKRCASDLEQLLIQRGRGAFSVIDQRRLQAVLKERKFQVADLGSDKAMQDLSKTLGDLPATALGMLRNRNGREITLQCRVVNTQDGSIIASAGGVAMLTPSQWAELGHSANIIHEQQEELAPSPDNQQQEERTQAEQIVYDLDKKSKQAHPLADPNTPFRVKFMVGGKERKGKFHGNDYLIPVKKGEVYELEVETRFEYPVIMRLLVDGLNTLPEAETGEKGVKTYAVAKRVDLEEARWWLLDPAVSKRFSVRGFVTETGTQGKMRRFTVVDGEESVAARQNFTEQLGYITVAFYEANSGPRGTPDIGSPGTGFGEEIQQDLAEASDFSLGKLLAVMNLRYASPEAIEVAVNQPPDAPAPAPQN
jgi:hypothetical protein